MRTFLTPGRRGISGTLLTKHTRINGLSKTVSIQHDGPPKVLGGFNPPTGFQTVSYFYDASTLFFGDVDHYTLMGTLPVGLSFNTSTGIIDGTPLNKETRTGLYVLAYNANGDSAYTTPGDMQIVEVNAVTYNGEVVTYNGEVVTYG